MSSSHRHFWVSFTLCLECLTFDIAPTHPLGGLNGDGFPICFFCCTHTTLPHNKTHRRLHHTVLVLCPKGQQVSAAAAEAALAASWIFFFLECCNKASWPAERSSMCVWKSVSLCVYLCTCVHVCNGKNSACPLAMCVFLIQEFLHVYICEYVFMFQSVCALHVCVHGEACQGQSNSENMWPGRTRARALEWEEEKK